MKTTLTNPTNMIVDKEREGKCKDPRCANKTLFWAKVIATGKKCLISLQPDGTWWQHFKDCESRNIFSATNPKYNENNTKRHKTSEPTETSNPKLNSRLF